MTDEPFEAVFEARVRYEPDEEITPQSAKETIKDLVMRNPDFGDVKIEYPDEDEE